jgi:hypothetical protein
VKKADSALIVFIFALAGFAIWANTPPPNTKIVRPGASWRKDGPGDEMPSGPGGQNQGIMPRQESVDDPKGKAEGSPHFPASDPDAP